MARQKLPFCGYQLSLVNGAYQTVTIARKGLVRGDDTLGNGIAGDRA